MIESGVVLRFVQFLQCQGDDDVDVGAVECGWLIEYDCWCDTDDDDHDDVDNDDVDNVDD